MELRGTKLQEPKWGQKQACLQGRWAPGDWCDADEQLSMLAIPAGYMVWPTCLCWAVATELETLPREYLAAALGFHRPTYSHCSTICRASYSSYCNIYMVIIE